MLDAWLFLQSWSLYFDTWYFKEIFLSPQVKRRVIISNKHGIYELPQDLPNVSRLRKYPSLPAKIKILSMLAKTK